MVKDNQDYFKRAGRSGGPRGTLEQFRSRLSQEKAEERRGAKGKAPKAPVTATEEAESQLQALGGEERHSVLDSLPKQVGAAGVPRSARPIPTRKAGEHEEKHATAAREEAPGRWLSNQQAFEGSPFDREMSEEEAPFGYGIPASEDTALGHERPPFEREAGEMRHAAREAGQRGRRELSPMQRRIVRTFPPFFRAVGSAARAIDRPIKEVLDVMQSLGRAARRSS